MKVKDKSGNVLKYKPNGYADDPNVHEWWQMCLELYEKATYVNDINIVVNPGTDRETTISKRFKDEAGNFI